jgi:hypothetical protein
MGNREITRPNFMAPKIRGRDALDFERLNATNIAQFGRKVQLSDETLDKLLGIDIPDPQDKKWLAEKSRRKALGESEEDLKANPPLGRPQRTVRKVVNIASVNLSINERLSVIKALMDANQTESALERTRLGAEIARVFNRVIGIEALSQAQQQQILEALVRIKMPINWRQTGLKHRLWTARQFDNSVGLLQIFLLNNVAESTIRLHRAGLMEEDVSLSAERPVMGIGGAPIKMSSVRSRLGEGQVLDIETRTMLSKNDAVAWARGGIDGGMLDGKIVEALPPLPEEFKEEEEKKE